MKITLASNAVAYDLWTLMVAIDPNLGRSVRGLQIQVPSDTIEAGNAGAVVKFGDRNAAATAVNEEFAMEAGDSQNYPQDNKNTISLPGIGVIASVNNCILYVLPLYG